MKVKINDKLICIPPYISTTWDHVTFLHAEEDLQTQQPILAIHLDDGNVVNIPNLDSSVIDIAFAAHLKFLEGETKKREQDSLPKTFQALVQKITGLSPEQIAGMTIRYGIGGLPNVEGIEMAFQHNQAQSNAPDLPQEMLEKVVLMAKSLANGDISGFPKPEPHCNCMHCQVARALHGIEKKEEPAATEEAVSEQDLRFRSWDIVQNGEKLYCVTNPENPGEQYNVYLGTPIGCTCGDPNCEHIIAVLHSSI
jgi:hypothetical protein